MSQSNYCKSIKSLSEPHLRCLLKKKPGCDYCAIHNIQKNKFDFNESMDEYLTDINENFVRSSSTYNPILKTIDIEKFINTTVSSSIKQHVNTTKKIAKISKEENIQVIENIYNDNQEDLEIKLLILINDEEYSSKIKELVGPIYHDVTLSEDEYDPITYDPIWIINNGKRIPAEINKYYLFSYFDSNDKIRCFTIFSIWDMLNGQENELKHPITQELIPEKDIERAKQLIDIYKNKIGLFREDNSNHSEEYKLKCRLVKLFKQFHVHSIYLEEKWLLDINDVNKLNKIITETNKLVKNNLKIINPKLKTNTLFQKRFTPKSKIENYILSIQQYIIEEWEKLISQADNPNNQIPIWIIVSGLSFVVPEIKEKFPDLEIMF
ncbi:hypothetical protein H012_gp624 [Acanthamoeba polyphaga moumouvirus]|uniref:Uncharacterized protein n=1 Tax=Acanthamoeba polyphaga moumouvirus TaxID=1269028 RepID=L7RBH3_9VIRU|nr:hypothetical protein H012_gp624 [Acanthamoeba polyphaga moumouvirus]AGC01839.1 hypothetical protein Moumou_00299 [Acanthamoeba polyphaga moumouvirus]AQN68195.1 hypothetical protein [Saudi moumouvirus]